MFGQLAEMLAFKRPHTVTGHGVVCISFFELHLYESSALLYCMVFITLKFIEMICCSDAFYLVL